MAKKLSSNMEDYLEAIISTCKKKGYAQVKDIKNALDVKMPSVTGALTKLKQHKLITQEKYGHIHLTPEGTKVAEEIEQKHKTLVKFLTDILKIDKKTAETDACKMEHIISPKTYEKIKQFKK
ncbi:MAG: metal-dependent transcriptional regulator [Elusimicrobiaceae bacterium]|jgi:DtxR family transcriptional regulator, Mn-dependent transcriptional regulator|nr:metal-dependent transcriptional regulator [Elusimicrobiaceae bacterium]MBT7087469.1 metal-dependent transcriptional regulator [bacterium]MBT3955651.1 metal-dependent transcriptional regulator [Elusimicrobiaceae bacterium]MBT4008295.1 metal-dependent transcriptional regulator [Elusimicrobiaceae bacterium]MBT4439701.1 metal-dependent transcriptional regulator [Elusimicrobiaceae bacterium]